MTSLSHEFVSAVVGGEARPRDDHLQLPSRIPGLNPDLIHAFRPRKDALAKRITGRICREIAGFADPGLAALVGRAINAAVDLFVDALAGAPSSGRSVSDYYWWLGRAEAQSGHDLDAMHAAHHIATQEVWTELDLLTVELNLPFAVHHRLAQSVMSYQRSLQDRALAGYVEAKGVPDPQAAMLTELLQGASLQRLQHLAGSWWPMPTTLAIATTEATPAAAECTTATDGTLSTIRKKRLVVIADSTVIDDVARAISRHSLSPVVVSWGVMPTEAPHAWRWVMRAVGLVRQHRINVPTSRIVRCLDHRAELLRYADPTLARQTMVDLLAPLLRERPSQRDALSQTMLLWLQLRASAPVLAGQLNVHDQTVRNHLRRIKAMFGETLDRPDSALELIQALHLLREDLDTDA